MDLSDDTIRAIMQAILTARSIQCLHLSGYRLKNYMSISKEVLGQLVFDRMTMKRLPPEVPSDWNEPFKLPNALSDEISAEVTSCFCDYKTKN
jgi:hypothetical protein